MDGPALDALSGTTLGHLRQLVDALSAGVILIHPAGTIL